MVQIIKLDHLEYKEAILDSPEFRDKLHRHEKHISDTSKNIKVLLKKFEDVINATEVLRNAQDSFAVYLKDFQLGFVGDKNEQESDVVDTLDGTYNLIQDIKEFSNKMINAGHALYRQLDNFRKDKLDNLKEKKKDYDRQTIRYCTVTEKYLTSSQSSSKRDRNNADEISEYRENDRETKEENQIFYRKCLDYILCIQEFEEKWFHFFAESIFAFIQSWTTYYHEGYERHCDFEPRYSKSNGGIQELRSKFDYFKSRSIDMINDILKNPEYHMNSFQTMSNEHFIPSSKQGYLYLIEKKTLGSTTRVKQFCKYYKDTKLLEVITYNQTTNKMHQPEYYTVNNCQKSSALDKRYMFDVSLKEKSYSNIHTYQALSYDDYKAWFAVMEGKELTPVLSPSYSLRSDPIYLLDRNGINFIKKCIKLLEEEKINEEGIYRKNGVSHKINQFIERNFVNLAAATISQPVTVSYQSQQQSNESSDQANSTYPSIFSSIKSTVNNFSLLSHSNSSSTLNNTQNANNATNNNQSFINNITSNEAAANSTLNNSNSTSLITRNNSNSNLLSNTVDFDDTCTITSALKHYLIHLKEPLMTFHFNQQFLYSCKKENMSDRLTEIHRLIHMLPPLNLEVLEALIKHLYRVSTHSLQNKMTTSNLATCFGPTVFRTEQECVTNLYNIKFYSEIIEILIIHHAKIFEKTLDSAYLANLAPLKAPPTMMGGHMTALNTSVSLGSSNHSLITSSTPNSKLRMNGLNNAKRYEPNYRNALMNSSKTSLSSDSSQSDREQQHNLINLSQLTSPLSTSLNLMTHSTSASSATKTSSVNTGGLLSKSTKTEIISTSASSTSKTSSLQQLQSTSKLINSQLTQVPYKPFNSQTEKYQAELNSSSKLTTNTRVSQSSNNVSNSPNVGLNKLTISTSTPINSSTAAAVNSSLNSLNSTTSNIVSSDGSSNKLKRARTLYACVADNPSELSFEANVIISNVRRSKESGWLEGTYNGKSGLVPGNYVQILDD